MLIHAFIFPGVVNCSSFIALFEKLQMVQCGQDKILNRRDVVTYKAVRGPGSLGDLNAQLRNLNFILKEMRSRGRALGREANFWNDCMREPHGNTLQTDMEECLKASTFSPSFQHSWCRLQKTPKFGQVFGKLLTDSNSPAFFFPTSISQGG